MGEAELWLKMQGKSSRGRGDSKNINKVVGNSKRGGD